jgi:hypothetical protein
MPFGRTCSQLARAALRGRTKAPRGPFGTDRSPGGASPGTAGRYPISFVGQGVASTKPFGRTRSQGAKVQTGASGIPNGRRGTGCATGRDLRGGGARVDTIGAQSVGCSEALVARPGNSPLPVHGLPQPQATPPDLPGVATQLIKLWRR